MSLIKSQIQLDVLHSNGVRDQHAVAGIPQAFAILLDNSNRRKGILAAKSALKLNMIHPAGMRPPCTAWSLSVTQCCIHSQLFRDMHHAHAGKAPQPKTLVTNLSADAGLQQQAMLELLQLCRNTENCSPSLMTECIAQGGVEVSINKLSIAVGAFD